MLEIWRLLERKSSEWAEENLVETGEGSEKASCSNRVLSVWDIWRYCAQSRVFLIRWRSRVDRKQDLETKEMWSDIEKVESKMTPRLRAEEVGVMMALDGMRRLGSEILGSCTRRPMGRNSVLDWLSDKKLEDIYWDTRSSDVAWRCEMLVENSEVTKRNEKLITISIHMMTDGRVRCERTKRSSVENKYKRTDDWSLRDTLIKKRLSRRSWVDSDHEPAWWQVWCELSDKFAIEAKPSW